MAPRGPAGPGPFPQVGSPAPLLTSRRSAKPPLPPQLLLIREEGKEGSPAPGRNNVVYLERGEREGGKKMIKREREMHPLARPGMRASHGVSTCKAPVAAHGRFSLLPLFTFPFFSSFFFFKQHKPNPGVDPLRVYLRLITSHSVRRGGGGIKLSLININTPS